MKKLLVAVAFGAAFVSAQAEAHLTPTGPQANLTRQDAVNRADAIFQKLDYDHDGILTRDEAMIAGVRLRAQSLATGVDAAPGIGGRTERYLERVFANAQSVNRRQFEQAMLAHFNQMDTDHDGILTPAERAVAYARSGR
jgi:hypothetical protein